MTMVAETYEFIVGVDTHSRTHTYALMAARTGAIEETKTFPASGSGINRAAAWIHRAGGPERSVIVAVEGTGSYGAALTRALTGSGLHVVEARPPRRGSRGSRGKSDAIDAIAAARATHALDTARLVRPRAEGTREALTVLLAARRRLDTARTINRNALNALVRTTDLGLDARRALMDAQIELVASWRPRAADPIQVAVARNEARRLAREILTSTASLKENKALLGELVQQLAPGLQNEAGVGPVTAALVLAAYSHHGRVRSEAAFAALAGACPIPASSGNTTRHRLNRNGDRQLNRALDVIARTRLTFDPRTRAYAERRTSEGMNRREIRRCLKRYVARQLYRRLQTIMA